MADKFPLKENQMTHQPESLYAATKIMNEMMAGIMKKTNGLQSVGVRFFTVYGPWGRPDMAPMLFTNAIMNGEVLKVFNNGEMERDFTFIDDIVTGITSILENFDKFENTAVVNIGKGNSDKLVDFISYLEEYLGQKAVREHMPMQKGDVVRTWADVSQLESLTGFEPKIGLKTGTKLFVDWYKLYHKC